MPYIKQKQRRELEKRPPLNSGEVNYLATKLMHKYFTDYESLNDIAVAIEDAIFELKLHGEYDIDPSNEFEAGLRGLIIDTTDVSAKKITGALRNAYMEFYALKARPYENIKKQENGDV